MIEYVMSVRYLLMGLDNQGNTHTCSREICVGLAVVMDWLVVFLLILYPMLYQLSAPLQ